MKIHLVILLLLLCGCGKSGKIITSTIKDGVELVEFDFTRIGGDGADSVLLQEKLNLSSLVQDLRVVKLETGDECLVTGGAEYFVGDRCILVSQNDRIILFDQYGHFSRVVALKGRGPREFNQVDDFTVDEGRGFIYILEYDNIKIFSLSDSLYFRQVNCAEREIFHSNLLPLENGNLLLAPHVYKKTGHWVYAQDTAGQLLGGTICPPNEANPHFVAGKKLLYRVGGELRYLSANSDSVYLAGADGTLKLKWVFKVKGNQEMRMYGETPGILLIGVNTITAKKVSEGYTETSYSACNYIYDKNQNRLTAYENLWNDYLEIEPEMPIYRFKLHNGERFCFPYHASLLVDLLPQVLESGVKPEVRERLENLQKTLSQDDNPVLLIGRMK